MGRRLQELGVSVPPGEVQWFVADLLRGIGDVGEYFVPPVVLSVAGFLLEGRSVEVVCDPWAGLGVLAATVREAAQARKTLACVPNPRNLTLVRALAPQVDWHTGDPFAFLGALTDPLDAVASVLPFGRPTSQAVELMDESGEPVRLTGDLGALLLMAASVRLSAEGVGLFVVTPSFFFRQGSAVRDLPRLGLGLEAALALPAGSFAPFSDITTYLVVVRKQPSSRMFVAQLSQDAHTNRQIVANLRERRADGPLDLGRFVIPDQFRGFDSLRLGERLREAERRFRVPPVRLGDLAREIRLGRPGEQFRFQAEENALYIPLIGISDVIDSTDEMTLKSQNYAQIVVDPMRSDARFVARFLNSELGRAIRDAGKSGTTIPKLNTSGLRELMIFVPNLVTQRRILDIAVRLAAEQNTLGGLQNELDAMRRDLWDSPDQCDDLDSRVQAFSGRLSKPWSCGSILFIFLGPLFCVPGKRLQAKTSGPNMSISYTSSKLQLSFSA
jgi:hypothetical protein